MKSLQAMTNMSDYKNKNVKLIETIIKLFMARKLLFIKLA